MIKQKKSFLDKALTIVEKGGNALPHPATLFGLFALITLVLSAIASWLGWTEIHPAQEGFIVEPENLLAKEGIHRIMLEVVDNFTSFAPLGIVLVAMLGIGIAEHSNLISAVIRLLVLSAPKRILTFVLVFTGILSNVASDVGYVLLIPLAGVIFQAVGRNPLAGMAAAFAGVSGGFSANLLLGTIDPLIAGLSEEAAQIVDPEYLVNPTANYYFMVASTFIISLVGTLITEKIVEPRLGPYKGNVAVEKIEKLSRKEKEGLLGAGITFMVITGAILLGILPENGWLMNEHNSILQTPLIKGVVFWLVVYAGLCGLTYGLITGSFKNDADVMNGMAESTKTLATYIVLVFFAAQFVAYFKWSNLGLLIAIRGASVLSAANLGLIPTAVLFIVFAAILNMFMGSASAKWAILAPIFIPIFMFMGYSPELSQVVYRIGDSITNIISPMMSFFALIIAFFQKYIKDVGIGTIIATMIPFTIGFFIVWTILLMVWVWFGIPLGPGAGLYYN